MLNSIKTLLFVLAIAAVVFRLSKPIALRFMDAQDFSRRRLLWFTLTSAGFLSPNIWLYATIAVPMLLWCRRNDSNPIALYLLLLHVIPPINVDIPIFGFVPFSIDNYRILALCLLLPVAFRLKTAQKGVAPASAFGPMDVLLLGFGVLNVALYTRPDLPSHAILPDSPINATRRAVLFLLDVYLVFFAVSRLCQSKKRFVDAIATFCLASALMAALAIFERARNWLLYVGIKSLWVHDPHASYYLARGGLVRAQVSAGHAIALGQLIVVAFGLWLYLGTHVMQKRHRLGVTLLMWGGLFGAFSRGAWLGGAVVFFTFIITGQRAATRLVKGIGIAFIFAFLVAMSPIGDQVMQMLPESGKPTDMYRYRLAERGWDVVFQNPLFGNQFPWPEMEDLRQGEGIIDIVNTYLSIALSYGLVGLFCFLSLILLGLVNTYRHSRNLAQSDPDLALLGSSLIACITGTLLMIDSSGFNLGIEKMFYVLAGLSSAYAQIIPTPHAESTERTTSAVK